MQKKCVLIVDDNQDNRAIYRAILEHEGYQVAEAEDGIVAVQHARALSPDLILMDLAMPRMNGWRATAVLKDDPCTREIPICALSAYVLQTAEERRRIEELGFERYLLKPINPSQVLSIVRDRIGPAAAAAAPSERSTRETALAGRR